MERNYEIHDKEMLAIIRALDEWQHFLEGATHKVEIWTDHKNLEYFMSAKKLNHRQARWSLTLARFDFVMHHQPGKSMGKSDALSRRADHGDSSEDNRDHLRNFKLHLRTHKRTCSCRPSRLLADMPALHLRIVYNFSTHM
jgi:hypothetical protein